jgi:hypothetical protein
MEGVDPRRGAYFHLTDVHDVMSASLSAPIPEASTWLMTFAGLGVMALFVRRSRH